MTTWVQASPVPIVRHHQLQVRERMERLLLVEDHGLLAHSLAAALRRTVSDVEVVDTTTVDALLPHLLARAPALVLLDLDLGDHGPATPLIEPLSQAGCTILILTGLTDPIAHARCLRAGSVGILGKDIAFDDLADAIASVRVGGTLVDPHEREQQLRRLREHDRTRAKALAPFESLTRREAEVLGQLMTGATADRIAADAVVSVATVRTQVRAILTKLGVSSQVAAVARAHTSGWDPSNGA